MDIRSEDIRTGSLTTRAARRQNRDLAILFASYHRSGAPELLAAIYRATLPILERVAWRITEDHLAAQDAVQDAFVDVLREPRRFDPNRAVMPWLVAVTSNKARAIRRRCTAWRRRERAGAALAPAAIETIEERDASEWLWRTVERLPRDQGEVVAMRYREGRSDEQVAALLDVPLSTVKSRLRSARARLRRVVDRGLASGG